MKKSQKIPRYTLLNDTNELSWTQVLEIVEFMSDAVKIPILLDGDTGYGNYNNMRRLVRKLEQRGVAGVCIEDKLFPKTNSFVGERQPLADIKEFCGKIRAGKDSQTDDSFCIVARVEALISGWGLAEALKRAEAYREAGADAILIHSKVTDSSEIKAFMREWGKRGPVVIVPHKIFSDAYTCVSGQRRQCCNLGQPPPAKRYYGHGKHGRADISIRVACPGRA